MRTVAVVLVGVAVLAVACGQADPWGDLPSTDTSAATSAASSCGPAIAGEDPTIFPKCTGTKGTSGRCIPSAGLGKFADTFEQADCKSDAACLPEELIKDGSAIQLKKCNAVLGNEGRCFWPLAKQVLSNYDLLKGATKDQCDDPDQVCAPCVHPVTHQDTGVCDVGAGSSCGTGTGAATNPAANLACPQTDPILDPGGFQQLECTAGMYCVDTSLVGALASKLAKCSKGVCAPSKSVLRGGMYIPPTCKSTGGFEGRCSNVGVPDIAAQKSLLPKDICDDNELCAPCFDPRDGSDTGACKQAPCDAPKNPPQTFAACCGGRAHCVPSSAVPASSASNLGADSCSGDTPLCAPNELIPMPNVQIKQCAHTFGLLPGICVSKCALPGAPLQTFLQADCQDDELCAPCSQLPAGTKGCN